ncbi:uncharacterized protein [Diadema antillarum]|uniref:uncharacterized protein n=1 Tax=Diadema antillarum TaxID=105358 RepID=UPI003A83DD4F
MVKQLMDLCFGCIAQNLNIISSVGKQLPTLHKEKILQWVVDHNMLTTDYLPHVTYHLFSPALRTISFCHCEQINDKLLTQLDACQCRLESITIEGCKDVTDAGISALLSHQTELKSLTLNELPELTGTGLEALVSANLCTVDMTQCINIVNRSILTVVSRNPTISTLNLGTCYKLNNEIIPVIASSLNTNLEHMDLTSFHTLEDSDLITLSQHCTSLRGLVMHGCNRITSAGLLPLFAACTQFQNLDISFSYKLQEPKHKEFLVHLPLSLRSLVLSGLHLEGQDILGAVSRLPKLHSLRLCGVNSLTEDSAAEIFQAIGPQLTCLDMTGCHQIMTDDLLRSIVKHCTSLEELALGFCVKLTGEPLRRLFRDKQRAKYLTLLRFSGCKEMTHDVLLDLSESCHNLEKLFLAGIKSVDDTLLFSIANHMHNLVHISLKSCVGSSVDSVTDSGVVELARYCPLQDICLAGIQNITDKSILALANNCPNLKALFVSGCSKVTGQATRYLQDVSNKKVHVYHRVPNADPNLVMAKNLDTGEFCRVDQTKWSQW